MDPFVLIQEAKTEYEVLLQKIFVKTKQISALEEEIVSLNAHHASEGAAREEAYESLRLELEEERRTSQLLRESRASELIGALMAEPQPLLADQVVRCFVDSHDELKSVMESIRYDVGSLFKDNERFLVSASGAIAQLESKLSSVIETLDAERLVHERASHGAQCLTESLRVQLRESMDMEMDLRAALCEFEAKVVLEGNENEEAVAEPKVIVTLIDEESVAPEITQPAAARSLSGGHKLISERCVSKFYDPFAF